MSDTPAARHEFSDDEARRVADSALNYERLAPPIDATERANMANGHRERFRRSHSRSRTDNEYGNEYANGHGHAGEQTSDGAQGRQTPLPILTDVEAESLPPPVSLIGSLLFEACVAFVYGPSGTWKSFLVLGWALCIATGRDWLGHPVTHGAVVYVVAEGAPSIGKRIKAWKRAHGVSGQTPLYIVPVPVALLEPRQRQALMDTIRQTLGDVKPKLVIVDTLSRSLSGGDENLSVDAADILNAAASLREAFGCATVFVHHTGYDLTHMRGSSAYFAGADVVIRVKPDRTPGVGETLVPGERVRLMCEKSKDDEPFSPIGLTTELQTWLVPVSDDETTPPREVGSLVIVPHYAGGAAGPQTHPEVPPAGTGPGLFTPAQVHAWKVLADATLATPEGILCKDWEVLACKKGKMVHSTFLKARDRLSDTGWVRERGALFRAATPDEPGDGEGGAW